MECLKAQEEKHIYMTEAPVEKLVRHMAVPTVISMLVTSIYNMADTFFVSLLNNTSATGATGIIFPVMMILQAIGFTLGQGSGNHLSRALGSKDYGLAEKISSAGFFSGIAIGMVLTLVGLSFLEKFVLLLGATETIKPYAMEYGGFILCGAPWMIGSIIINCQLRLQGSAYFSMIGLVLGAVINIILDPALIFLGGMGISGAALATIISQFVSFSVLFWGTHRAGNIAPKIKAYPFDPKIHKDIVMCGLPALLRQSLMGISTVCMNNVSRNYGDAVIAAVSIVSRIMNFSYSAALGMGQGFQPVCGFNYGAKKYDRVVNAYFYTLKKIFITLFSVMIIGMLFSNYIVNCFSHDEAVILIGAKLLRRQCTVICLQSFTIISNMLLQNIGNTVRASLLSAARQGLFFIPALFIFTYFLKEDGLLYVQMISDLCAFLVAVPLTIPILRKLKAK